MTTEQINKAAEEYGWSIKDFKAGVTFATHHSRQEIEELKAEIEHHKKKYQDLVTHTIISKAKLEAENDKLTHHLKMVMLLST